MELCNHISGCPNPATETTAGNNSETHRGRSVPGEKKYHLAITKKRVYILFMYTRSTEAKRFLGFLPIILTLIWIFFL